MLDFYQEGTGFKPNKRCLAITSTDSVPVGIRDGTLFHGKGLITFQEEADD